MERMNHNAVAKELRDVPAEIDGFGGIAFSGAHGVAGADGTSAGEFYTVLRFMTASASR